MFYQIPKTFADTLDFDLPAAIAAYQAALAAHAMTVDEPAPAAHPLVEAIVRNHDGAYEIIDDTPQETTAQKRERLVRAVQEDANRRMDAVSSPARRQLAQLDAGRIMATPIASRSEADTARLSNVMATNDRISGIYRHSLLLTIEIEDLLDTDLDTWTATGWPA